MWRWTTSYWSADPDDIFYGLKQEVSKQMISDWLKVDAAGAGLLFFICYGLEHDLFDGLPEQPDERRGYRLCKLEMLDDAILKATDEDRASIFGFQQRRCDLRNDADRSTNEESWCL